MSFEADINRMFDAVVADRSDYAAVNHLLEIIGCRVLRVGDTGWSMTYPEQPATQQEALVGQTLLRLLRVSAGGADAPWTYSFSLLDGFARNERWRLSLEAVDDAHLFADMLLQYKGFCDNFAGTKAEHLYKMSVQWVAHPPLADWLNLSCAQEFPSEESLARTMFGDVWYDLALNGASSAVVRESALTHRPAFRLGLLPKHLEPTALILPALDSD